MIHKVPLLKLIRHTAIANIGIDDYTITLSTTPVVENNHRIWWKFCNRHRKLYHGYDEDHHCSLELPNTSIVSTLRPTTATSPSGTETSFSTVSSGNAFGFPLNENFEFDAPQYSVPVSTKQMDRCLKSCFVDLQLNTTSTTVSPVIDMQRTTLLSVANRLNKIDSSSDVFPTTEFFASTEPDGDNNAPIYLTKQVALENPPTAIKVLFNAQFISTSDIKAGLRY